MPSIPFNNTSLRVITGILIFMLWQMNFIAILQMGFGLQVSLTDSLVNVLMLSLASMTIVQTFRYYNPNPSQFWIILLVGLVFSILFNIAAKLVLQAILKDNSEYIRFLNESTFLRGTFALLMVEWMIILNLLWNMLKQEIKQRNMLEETMVLAREAELYKLRQQLQPHFLFNSLNSINALVGSKPGEARKMIEQLSTFLRSTINSKEDDLVPLTEEMEQIDRYLEIEKLRFGHRLNTNISIGENCDKALLPPLLLQPVVENAIKFGLYDTLEDVTINIETECREGFLQVTVSNPFDPASTGSRKGTGFGLTAVQRRLYLLFGRQDLLLVHPEGNNYITTIKIPQTNV